MLSYWYYPALGNSKCQQPPTLLMWHYFFLSNTIQNPLILLLIMPALRHLFMCYVMTELRIVSTISVTATYKPTSGNRLATTAPSLSTARWEFFLHTPPGFPWTWPGQGNVILHLSCKTTLMYDVSITILMSFLTSSCHFCVILRPAFRRRRIREEPYRTFLDRKMQLF